MSMVPPNAPRAVSDALQAGSPGRGGGVEAPAVIGDGERQAPAVMLKGYVGC
jgi:hypothetical protein